MNVWSYVWGQCTYWAAKLASWIPAGLGNANTWVPRARAMGYPISSTPVKGSVVEFLGPGYSSLGHVAVVTDVFNNGTFKVSEMNNPVPGISDVRTVRANDPAIQGFILPKGSGGGVNPAQAFDLLTGNSTPGANINLDVPGAIGNLTSTIGAIPNAIAKEVKTGMTFTGFFILGIIIIFIALLIIAAQSSTAREVGKAAAVGAIA